MVGKYALFAFNGDPMCFVHVILNALDLKENGFDVKVIIEGSATKLVSEFNDKDSAFFNLYQKLLESNLIDCFCKACSNKMGVLSEVEQFGFRSCNELSGHPSMAKYIQLGYSIISF